MPAQPCRRRAKLVGELTGAPRPAPQQLDGGTACGIRQRREGTMSLLVEGQWVDAKQGSFVLIPGGSVHDFENRSSERAGVLNFSAPGDFEEAMPGIAQWFVENPPGYAL